MFSLIVNSSKTKRAALHAEVKPLEAKIKPKAGEIRCPIVKLRCIEARSTVPVLKEGQAQLIKDQRLIKTFNNH